MGREISTLHVAPDNAFASTARRGPSPGAGARDGQAARKVRYNSIFFCGP